MVFERIGESLASFVALGTLDPRKLCFFMSIVYSFRLGLASGNGLDVLEPHV